MKLSLLAVAVAALVSLAPSARAQTEILNASYDLSREFYGEFNPAFEAHYKKTAQKDVKVRQSNGGSSKQARAVADGLKADVVTFNQETDIQLLVDQGLVSADWKKKLPNNASPYRTLTIVVVRKGNPKKIKGWDDLAKPGVGLVAANPKTSGNGRYVFLGAAAHAHKKFKGDEAKVKGFLKTFYGNFPILPTGGRDLTTAFVERGVGDALLTFEAEALLLLAEFPGKYEIVVPPSTVSPDFPVAVVDKVVDGKGTRGAAEAFVKYLFSDAGQELAAKYHYRVTSKKIAARNKDKFPRTQVVDVNALYGPWSEINKKFFGEDGWFDQIYVKQ
jgi:sulfate transport system substrate-binding protein